MLKLFIHICTPPSVYQPLFVLSGDRRDTLSSPRAWHRITNEYVIETAPTVCYTNPVSFKDHHATRTTSTHFVHIAFGCVCVCVSVLCVVECVCA